MEKKEAKLTACLQSVFSVFKAQVAASHLFQKESGLVSYKDLIEEWPSKIKSFFNE
jgi:hypothetical protein